MPSTAAKSEYTMANWISLPGQLIEDLLFPTQLAWGAIVRRIQ